MTPACFLHVTSENKYNVLKVEILKQLVWWTVHICYHLNQKEWIVSLGISTSTFFHKQRLDCGLLWILHWYDYMFWFVSHKSLVLKFTPTLTSFQLESNSIAYNSFFRYSIGICVRLAFKRLTIFVRHSTGLQNILIVIKISSVSNFISRLILT